MTVVTDLAGVDNFVLQEVLSAYTDEAYKTAKKLSGTGIVGDNPSIVANGETFMGQMRWFKPLTPVINVASLTNAAAGAKTSYSSMFLNYIKSVRTHGAENVNMKDVVTQQDGLAKIARDFANTRAQDEHNALLSILKGVAISEALNGAATGTGSTGLGGQSFTSDDTDAKYGFYVDLGAALPVIAASSTAQGAARAEGILTAFGKAYKDHEPAYAYLVTSPEVLASFRSANLVDQDRVVEANVEFQTIFNGKFRIILTRADQSMSGAELAEINAGAGVDITGTKTSFVVLPGAIAMKPVAVPMDTEITRDGNAYNGGGLTSIWYRWGYVMHPAGYSWNGPDDAFPSDADYKSVMESDVKTAVTSITTVANARGIWTRKFTSALSLGILPIFHG
jgi:hypothetical protein